MLLTRIYLRNYRVYEDELDLELPPGLVGIFGANGAGKSFLCESVLFSLWGRTRTTIADVRTTGVNGDCVAEVQFEHEGHLYTVRRTITGASATVKASAFADGQQVAEGVRDTGRYVHSILGMDDAAFRSSVFAEQKQLAAFSNQRPQQRKDLVLRLLGVMPLDSARDDARRDARTKREQLEGLSAVLPDLVELRHAADDAGARAEVAAKEAGTEEQVAAKARAQLAEAQDRLDGLEELGRRHEQVVAEGRAARDQHDGLARRVAELEDELAQLAEAGTRLEAVAGPAEGLAAKEAELAAVKAVAGAAAGLARIEVPSPPPAPDEAGCDAARAEAEEAATRLAGVEGELGAARAELARAEEAAGRSDLLSDEAECPLCGQALGDAFGQVQAHRAAEVERGRARVGELQRMQAGCRKELAAARERATTAALQLKQAQEAWQAHQRLAALRASAAAALEEAEAALGRPFAPGELERLTAEVAEGRAAAAEATRLRALLERRPALVAQHEAERHRRDAAAERLEELRATARALGFHPERLQEAREQRAAAVQAAESAAKLAGEARLEAEKLGVVAAETARRLDDAEKQHARLADLVEETRHLGRLADLLSAFRNSVVATVGPRLAMQAADLFAELTDHEYDELKLDPDTYEIQICDRGLDHGMARFSGSETDLANLAVRVAISEHVRLLSGGSVGLLVLDEVFGPLDEDRKRRMLGALQRLKGRFRQVLVVTHDDAVKAELPHAIEVVKLPGRRATARLVTA